MRQTLATSTGAWSGTPPIPYSYRWARCASSCSAIAGATSANYTLTSADAGAKIAVVVTATNTAGNAQATSSEVGPVVAPAMGPSSAQIRAALSKVLKPSGKAARIKAIVKAGGYRFTFTAPSAGELGVTWYATVKGKHVVVASARVVFPQAGKATVKLKLTGTGRKLLKAGECVKANTKATFIPSGGVATNRTESFTLKQ